MENKIFEAICGNQKCLFDFEQRVIYLWLNLPNHPNGGDWVYKTIDMDDLHQIYLEFLSLSYRAWKE